jgi:hypothetical protein
MEAWRGEKRGQGRSYLHIFERALLKGHVLVEDVDKEVPVAKAYTTVAVDDFAGWVGERRGLSDSILDLVAVAGSSVCGAGRSVRGLNVGYGVSRAHPKVPQYVRS